MLILLKKNFLILNFKQSQLKKNKQFKIFSALDTQAPITMGEDDDEQTGNYRYYPQQISSTVGNAAGENSTNLPIGSAVSTTPVLPRENTGLKLLQNDDHEIWRNDKPKYKRQEFMRYKFAIKLR